jgi:hypothetical protein
MLLKLIADFIATLITTSLPLAVVFNSGRAILSQILPGGSRSTNVTPRAGGGGTHGSTAGNSRRDFCRSVLQEIGRCATRSSRARYSGGARGRTRNLNEII